jgi:hypothetical protein
MQDSHTPVLLLLLLLLLVVVVVVVMVLLLLLCLRHRNWGCCDWTAAAVASAGQTSRPYRVHRQLLLAPTFWNSAASLATSGSAMRN